VASLLGCADQYTVEIHAIKRVDQNDEPLPAAEIFYVGSIDGVSRIRWGRVLRDFSEATIDIDFVDASPGCCRLWNRIEARVSQIRIFRDNVQVWEGEVIQPIETFGSPIKQLICRDILHRLDEVVNAHRLFTEEPMPITQIAFDMIEANLMDAAFDDPVDSSIIMPQIVVIESEEVTNYRRGAVVDTLGSILRQMAQSYALDFTVINRSLRLQRRITTRDQTQARITTEHFDGDVDVLVNGLEAGVRGWATTQRDGDSEGDDDWPGITETYLPDVNEEPDSRLSVYRYGRIDVLRHMEDSNATQADVKRSAKNAVWNRNPPPTEVRMPGSAKLTASAPLSMEDLIPGIRLDVFIIEGLCSPVRQGMRLVTLEVEWEENGTETVSVGLSTLSDVTGAA
jgi:hypothetical protein